MNDHTTKPPSHKPSRRITLTCATCGAEFTRPPSAVKGKELSYCNLTCAGKGYSKTHSSENAHQYSRIVIACAQCGKQLSRKPSHAKRSQNHFCNRECMGKWHSANEVGNNSPHYKSAPVPCRHCGTQLLVPPARVNEDGNFCDLDCYGQWLTINNTGPDNPFWAGGAVAYYGPNWHTQRQKARERDNHTCQHCGTTRDEAGQELDVHHMIPFREFGQERYQDANQLSNLITLCRKFHTTADNVWRLK